MPKNLDKTLSKHQPFVAYESKAFQNKKKQFTTANMGGIKDQNMGNADLNLENRIHAFSIWVVSEPWNG